jgi:hypothetical protein
VSHTIQRTAVVRGFGNPNREPGGNPIDQLSPFDHRGYHLTISIVVMRRNGICWNSSIPLEDIDVAIGEEERT